MWSKNLDAFVKPREDLRSKSALGGLITIIASVAAGLLFLGQMYYYIFGVTRHSLHLSSSQWHPVPALDDFRIKGRIPLNIHVSFPHVECSQLELSHDGMPASDAKFIKIHGRGTTVDKKQMTPSEWRTAMGTKGSASDYATSCTIKALYDIPRVGGSFSIGMHARSWAHAASLLIMGLKMPKMGSNGRGSKVTQQFNMTHYIHSITFGDAFPLMENPLSKNLQLVQNDHGGVALSNINVKLVQTKYSTLLGTQDTYQMSVTNHVVQPETLASQGSKFLPGMGVSYDFTPLAVHHVEARDNILVFLSSLISIVGGAFVTMSLVTGAVVHSAAAVAKKMD